MRSARPGSRLAAWGMAIAGTLLGHAVAYILAIPEEGGRARHLEAAGHSYLGAAAWLAAAAAAASIALVLMRHMRRRDGSDEGLSRLSARLLALQLTGFVVLEATERALAGVSPLEALDHHVILVGLAVQAILAIGSALFLHGVALAGALIGGLVRPRRASARAGLGAGGHHPLPRLATLRGWLDPRAPPATSRC